MLPARLFLSQVLQSLVWLLLSWSALTSMASVGAATSGCHWLGDTESRLNVCSLHNGANWTLRIPILCLRPNQKDQPCTPSAVPFCMGDTCSCGCPIYVGANRVTGHSRSHDQLTNDQAVTGPALMLCSRLPLFGTPVFWSGDRLTKAILGPGSSLPILRWAHIFEEFVHIFKLLVSQL